MNWVRLTCFTLVGVLVMVLVTAVLPLRSAHATSTLIQTNNANNTTSSVSATYSKPVTAGDLLIVICSEPTATTLTGPTGFTAAVVQGQVAAQGIYYKIATGSETTETCTDNSTGILAIQLLEYSGIENINPLDGTTLVPNYGYTNPAPSGNVSTRNYNDLLVAAISVNNASGVSGWTNSFIQEIGVAQKSGSGKSGMQNSYATADTQVSSSGIYSSSITIGGTSPTYVAGVAAFKIAPSPVFSGDIVDSTGASIASPSVIMSPTSTSFSCQTSTGTLGSSAQKIRITNTLPTDKNGWNLTLSPSSTNWTDGAGHSYSYDTSSGSLAGCSSGQLTVNPMTATITPEASPEYGCTTTGLSLSPAAAFTSSTAIPLITATASSSYYCYWDITGISLSQTIPPGQHGGSYSINLTLTLTAL